MKLVYLDTNLFVSLIKSNDKYYNSIQIIISQNHLSFVTSITTLIELSSVLSREYNNLNLNLLFSELEIERKDTPSTRIILFLIDYLITKTKCTIISEPQIELLDFFQQKIMINPSNKIAILVASKIQLRTLDLIHYANSVHYNHVNLEKIDYILSGDKNFISNGRSGTRNMTFITPEKFIELECK